MIKRKIMGIKDGFRLHNGVIIPYLGLGVYKAKEGEEVQDAIDYALDAGYRHIDTASIYNNEEGVGRAVNLHRIPRDDIFVTTKVWNTDQGYDETLRAFETSLNKLGFHRIDLYLIHWPVADKYLDTWRALERLYDEGVVRAIGVSNFHQSHLEDLMAHSNIKPMVNQVEFHPRLRQQPLLDFCQQQDIQFEAWSPLMHGELFTLDDFVELETKYNKSISQLVLRWNLQKGIVTIPKSVNPVHIDLNAELFDFELTDDEMAYIDRLDKNQRTGPDPDNFDF